jgi:hypothetical protein
MTAVLGPLATYAEPHAYDLCEVHSERMSAPAAGRCSGSPRTTTRTGPPTTTSSPWPTSSARPPVPLRPRRPRTACARPVGAGICGAAGSVCLGSWRGRGSLRESGVGVSRAGSGRPPMTFLRRAHHPAHPSARRRKVYLVPTGGSRLSCSQSGWGRRSVAERPPSRVRRQRGGESQGPVASSRGGGSSGLDRRWPRAGFGAGRAVDSGAGGRARVTSVVPRWSRRNW